jgi:purine-binding chemotaxis protein CheW
MPEQRNPVSLLVFTVGGQRYGLPVTQVTRIIEMVAMLDLPGAPDGVQGMINVQGQVVPVIDLRRRWALPPQIYTLRTPIILVREKNEAQLMGLVVDKVDEVVEITPEQLKRLEQVVPAESVAEVARQTPHLAGVVRWGQQLGLLVKIEALLDPAEQEQLTSALQQTNHESSQGSDDQKQPVTGR